MKTHLIAYDERNVYCGARSWLMPTTNDVSEVTCKVCEGLYKIQIGQIDELPFGGDYDKKGNLRKNIGRGKRRVSCN